MQSLRAFFVLVCLVMGSGCADMDHQQMGTTIGALVGGAAGSQLKNHRVLGLAGGAAVGGLIGNRIGRYLTEQDRQRAAEATARTARTGSSEQFRTTSGAMVTTTATPEPAIPARPAPKSSASSASSASTPPAQECRTIRQTIVLSDGSRETEDVRVCNGPDGWQPA